MYPRLKATLAALACAWALPSTDPGQLVSAMAEAEALQEKLRASYTAHEHAEHFRLNANSKKGRLNFTEDYELIWLEGAPYRKKIARNGKPLAGPAALEEDRKMRLTAAERRLEMAAGKIPRILRFGDVDWRDVARLLDHHWLGEETIDGRRAAVIESIPNPAVPGETPAATRALSYRYKFWIDLTDYVLLKTEVEVVRPGVDSAPGSRITSWRARVGNVWLMKAWSGNFHTEGSRWWRQEHVFTHFREFAAESKIDFTSPERKPLPPVH